MACVDAATKKAKVELQEGNSNAEVPGSSASAAADGARTSTGPLPAFLQKSRVEALYGQAQVPDANCQVADEQAAKGGQAAKE